MLPLAVDPASGFLTSKSITNATFTPEKKQQFLELAMSAKQSGQFPDLGLLSDQVGISMTCIDRHLRQDAQFKEMWDEIVLHTDAQVMKDCFDLRKKNPMYLFGLMRRIMPSRWSPDTKQTLQVDVNFTDRALDRAKAYDAELVQPSELINETKPLISANVNTIRLTSINTTTSTSIEENDNTIKSLERQDNSPTPYPSLSPSPSPILNKEKGPGAR